MQKHFIMKCHHGNFKSLKKEVLLLLGRLICNNELYLIKFKGLDIVEMCWSPNEGSFMAAATTTSADLPDNNNWETIHNHSCKVMLKKSGNMCCSEGINSSNQKKIE